MDLPIALPIAPMLAKAASEKSVWSAAQTHAYEPKWDGFRCIIARDGDDVELFSRGSKTLTKYFPEVVQAALAHLPPRCVLDGELIVRAGAPGAEHLSWDQLSQRIHPAESRIARLSEETPAEFVAFDLLVVEDLSVLAMPLRERRNALEELWATVAPGAPVHLSAITTDPERARAWFTTFEGAGLDGVIAKNLDGAYEPGKRTMLKLKHRRTAEAVVTGYRIHKSGSGVGSLLLSLYTPDGALAPVGGIVSFPAAQRVQLVEELAPLVLRDEDSEVVAAEGERSRFSSGKDVSFVPLRPERVVEVAFDQLEGHRFRHAVTFLRWRPDRDPASCLLEQVDRAAAYDLAEVFREVGSGS